MIPPAYNEHITLEKLVGHAYDRPDYGWYIYEAVSAHKICEAMAEALISLYGAEMEENPFISLLLASLNQAAQFNIDFSGCAFDVEVRIKAGDLVILPVKISNPPSLAHLEYLVFFRGYYAVCNRGLWKPEQAKTIEMFSIHPARFNADMLRMLKIFHSSEEAETYLYHTLPIVELAGKNLVERHIWSPLSPKMQTVGNCAYAGAEAAARAAACFYQLRQRKSIPLAVQWGKDFSKTFSTRFRLYVLDKYCLERLVPRPKLIADCWAKSVKRLHPDFPLAEKFPFLFMQLRLLGFI